MEAGFYPLGRDLGGGALDHQCFLRDEQREIYLENKRGISADRHWVTWTWEGEELTRLHYSALSSLIEQLELSGEPAPRKEFNQWCELYDSELSRRKTQGRGNEITEELPPELITLGESLYQQIAMGCQEDITVLAQQPSSALVMGHICTPSFWNPAHVKNASFWSIHTPVPGFPRDERVADRLANHISQRGPFVRFVWTLSSDDQLDHHPKHPRLSWLDADQIWYRVERQITIPLNGLGAVFLIRTYVHPLDRLETDQRQVLRSAIELMPAEIAVYKGLRDLQHNERLLSMIASR